MRCENRIFSFFVIGYLRRVIFRGSKDPGCSDLESRRNSMFYHAGSEKTLAQQGVLTRFLKNLKDVKGVSFDESIDLRQAQTINFTPENYGLKSIRGIEVWPEAFKEGRDYTVQVSEDGGQQTGPMFWTRL